MDDARPFSAAALYDTDFVAWTERQAALLLAKRGEDLDYERLAEEVGDLGKSELHACTSQVTNVLLHLSKIEFVGPLRTVPHWRGETLEFRDALQRRLTPTLQRYVLEELENLRKLARRRLVLEELLTKARAAEAAAYAWSQIVDSDFYPEPRYA